MPVNKELLEILCCPETKQTLRMMEPGEVEGLNGQIAAGNVKYADGNAVDQPLQEGLITESGDRVYRVDDDIPIMLVEQSIPAPLLSAAE